MATQQKKIQHLYLRATFGASPSFIHSHLSVPIAKQVDDLFIQSSGYRNLNYLENPVKHKAASNFQILIMLLKSRDQMQQLNLEWLNLMAATQAQLREKMTFFWHDHFATSTPLAWLMQVQNDTLRKYALSSFGKLLHAIAKDPAMIIYLNNQENRKDHPNENFAREVMELFTLGEGHYTEHDIKEAARAFTGWTVNRKGEFEFNRQTHDDGEKEFLGKKGNFGGEDILNMLLEEKQTAKFITTKIYKEFVNENTDDAVIETLSAEFYKNNYDITKLLKSIFTSDWFYDDKNIGSKIISPVELIVRYKRLIALDSKDDKTMLGVQKVLGQVLFFPPNVAGWKGGRNWADSSTLLIRMNFPDRIIRQGGFDIRPKPEPEDAPEDDEVLRTKKSAPVFSDWTQIVKEFRAIKENELTEYMIEAFIQCPENEIDRSVIDAFVDHSTDEKRIISTAGLIMSLPEFQLI